MSEVIQILKEKRAFLRERFAVKEIGIFGSYSKSQQNEDSDIDIYVEFYFEELTVDKYLSLINYLESIFNKKIDLITKDGLRTIRIPEVKKDIEEHIIYV